MTARFALWQRPDFSILCRSFHRGGCCLWCYLISVHSVQASQPATTTRHGEASFIPHPLARSLSLSIELKIRVIKDHQFSRLDLCPTCRQPLRKGEVISFPLALRLRSLQVSRMPAQRNAKYHERGSCREMRRGFETSRISQPFILPSFLETHFASLLWS